MTGPSFDDDLDYWKPNPDEQEPAVQNPATDPVMLDLRTALEDAEKDAARLAAALRGAFRDDRWLTPYGEAHMALAAHDARVTP